MKKPIVKSSFIYTKSQIIWGLVSIVLFVSTVLFLNLNGFTQTPNWVAKKNLKPSSAAEATPKIATLAATNINLPNKSMIFASGNTLYSYSLIDMEIIPSATISGEIITLGNLKNGGLFMAAGNTSQSYDRIYVQNNDTMMETALPSIPSTWSAPAVSKEGNYIYFQTNIGSGKKLIMRHEVTTGQQQEVVESRLPIKKMVVNDSNSQIALLVEMTGSNQQKNYVLGIVQIGAKNLNLFPVVELREDSNLLFTADGKTLILDTISGVTVFDLTNLKVSHNITDSVMSGWSQNNYLSLVQKEQNLNSCRQGLSQIKAYQTISAYIVDKGMLSLTKLFDPIKQLKPVGMLFASPTAIRYGKDDWLLELVDIEKCNKHLAIYKPTINSMEMIKMGEMPEKFTLVQ